MADHVKGAAESELHAVDRPFLRETSFAHMTRLATELHEQLDRRPHPTTPGLPATEGEEALTRTPPRAQGPGRPILPAPLGARSHRNIPMQPAEKDPVIQMLVVWAGLAAGPPSPFRQARGLGGAAQEDVG